MRNTQEKKVFWLESDLTRCVFVIEGKEAKITTLSLSSSRIKDVEIMNTHNARLAYKILKGEGWQRTR